MNLAFILENISETFSEVLAAVIPVLFFFLIFLFAFRLPKQMLANLFKGIVLAFAGLVLFLQGVKVGFMPVGMEMGSILGALPNRWILIPLGFLLGFLATLAEPAVQILSSQVEDSSTGFIRSSIMLLAMCLAVGLFIALGMTRIVYGIPLYYILIPGYLLAIILMFFSKPSFTAIAFDSGGVATGPMIVTFIMALAVGAADVIEGRDAVVDGFGLVALVALAPIIMVMLLGFLYPPEEEPADEPVEDDAPPDNDNHYPVDPGSEQKPVDYPNKEEHFENSTAGPEDRSSEQKIFTNFDEHVKEDEEDKNNEN